MHNREADNIKVPGRLDNTDQELVFQKRENERLEEAIIALKKELDGAAGTALKERLLFDSIINSLPGIFYLFDETGKYLRWNNNFETVSGYTASEIKQRNPLDFFEAEERPLIAEKITEVFTNGKADVEAPIITKGNEKIPYYFTGLRILYENKTCLIGVGLDITERIKTGKSLIESQQSYRKLLDNMIDGFIVDDTSGKIIFANKKFLEIYGFSEDDIPGLFIQDCFATEYHETLLDRHRRRLSGEKVPDVFEYEAIRKDGKRIWLGVRVNPVIKNGLITGTQSIIRDITEYKRAETALRESEETFRRLFNESAEPVLLLGDDGFIDCNQAAVSMLGYSSKLEIIHKKPWDISPEKQPDGTLSTEKAWAMILKALQDGYNRFEWVHIRSDGIEFPVEVMLTSIILKGRNLLYAAVRDITSRKKAEAELIEKEFFLRESQEAANIGSYKANFVTGYWQSSETLDSIFGIDKNYDRSIAGWLDIVHPDDRQMMDEYLRLEVLGKHKSFNKEYRIVRKNDQQIRWVLGLGELKYHDNGTIITLTGTIQDITDRKKVEEELLKSNERYEFVNKATQDTIWEWDYGAREGRWGKSISEIFGYSKEDMKYGENWLDDYIHSQDKEQIRRSLQHCIESGIENWQGEYRFRCADGTYKFVYDRGFVMYDDQGNPHRMIGAITDLTEKKRLERELAEHQIRQQKLITEVTIQSQENERNELGRELHDNINQILATAKMFLGMAISGKGSKDELIAKSHTYVNEAMEEIRKLSHSLVAPSLGDIGLKDAFEQLIMYTNPVNDLHIKLVMDENIDERGMDKNKKLMFYRIVQEQLNNIIKYAGASEAVVTFRKEKDRLFLSVADNGVGFDLSQKGKGIGLRNISSRVEFYSGDMNILSFPGKGCSLEVAIPE